MQIASTLLTFLAILLFLLVWGWTILRAYPFIWKREPELLDRLFWLALVIAFPLIGYIIFRVAFSLGRALAADTAMAQGEVQTQIHRPDGLRVGERGTGAARPQGFWLTVVAGPEKGDQVWVDSFPAVVGRGPEAAVRLESDTAISRQHAQLNLRDGTLLVRDLGSRHGTRINGKPVREGILQPGDSLEVGSSTIVIQSGGTV